MNKADQAPIALNILTGFLGAGKTTLLNRLLKDPTLSDTAVIINEFGEIAIDHLLVEQASDGIVELGDGCVCCTIRGELIEQLLELSAERPSLRRVIVETTGLADPTTIIQAALAHPELSRRYRLDGVITLVDSVNGVATLESYPEAGSQVAVADRLVLSKTDLISDNEKERLSRKLSALNPHAGLADSRAEVSALPLLLAGDGRALHSLLPNTDAHHHHHHHGHEHDHAYGADAFQSVSLCHDGALPWSAIENFLDLLATQQGENILRLKGLVETTEDPGRPILVQGAQKILHVPEKLTRWPDARRGTRMVVIGKALDTDYIKRIFAAFAGRSGVDTPDRAALEDNPLAISGFRP